jgi:hypothetical protein
MADTKNEVETALTLKLRSDAHYAHERACRHLVTRPPMQRKPCWTDQDKTDMIDTCARGWICPPIYIIPHLDLTDSCPEGEDHVFDGAHKLESVFEFMDGSFPLRYSADSLPTAYLRDHNGRRFAELPRELQERIRKYRFHINIVDSATAADPDLLRILWERVNRSGKKLNKFELEIPIIAPLLERVLKPALSMFMGTELFTKEISHRGELEQRLQVILALSDLAEPAFSSQTSLIQHWHRECLGNTMAMRTLRVEEGAARWSDTLVRVQKMLGELVGLNVFCDAEGKPDIAEALRKTELPFVLGRLARCFPRIEDFRSQKVVIAWRLREDIFSKTPEDMGVKLGGSGRNGTFQKKLLRFVDNLVSELAGAVQPRLFTKKQKEAKLKEQGGKCAACGERIFKHQVSQGDHIVAWSEGGKTDIDNLQILHRHCHQVKTSGDGAVGEEIEHV